MSTLKIVKLAEHRDRVKQLKKLGYKVKIVTLPNGDRLVLTSRKRFVCRAHHCTWQRDPGGSPAVPWKRTVKAKPKKRGSAARAKQLQGAIAKVKKSLAANQKQQAALRKSR
jgi:hypothetical protein